MKRRIILSIALVLSIVLVSLMSSDSTVKGQSGSDHAWATFATLGPNQILRITVVGNGGSDMIGVRITWTQYMAAGCSGMPPVCRHTVASQGATPVFPLGSDAFSFDVPGNGNGVNVVVLSNNRNVRVNALIIDALTGKVTSQIIVANTEGDIH